MIRAVQSGLAVALTVLCATTQAQIFTNFNEYGTTVNGFQDDFNGATMNSAWQEVGADPGANFQQLGGVMRMLPAAGDPNKLLVNGSYTGPQNVLALIRNTSPGTAGLPNTDYFRGGVGAGTSATTSTAPWHGVNLHYRVAGTDSQGSNHFSFLNDGVAWNAVTSGDTWAVGQWKWLRLYYNPATDMAMAKIWDAGSTPEPATWDQTWITTTDRFGLAGLTTNSGNGSTIIGNGVFDVEYFLLQSAGLPSIVAARVPEPTTVVLWSMLGVVGMVVGARQLRRRAG